MPAKLITKEEIIDLKNCFAFGKDYLDIKRFYHRNCKTLNKDYCIFINLLFDLCSLVFGIGWTSKDYKWYINKAESLYKDEGYIQYLKDSDFDESELTEQNIKQHCTYGFLVEVMNDYAIFISNPFSPGYKDYINNDISFKKAENLVKRYLKVIEKEYGGCPPFDHEHKYWKIIFRENNPFYKALFNK